MGYYTKYLGQEFGFGDLVDLSEKIEQAQKAAGKTLIGTCGDCGHWDYDREYGGFCGNPLMTLSGNISKDFGCNHWEEKP